MSRGEASSAMSGSALAMLPLIHHSSVTRSSSQDRRAYLPGPTPTVFCEEGESVIPRSYGA